MPVCKSPTAFPARDKPIIATVGPITTAGISLLIQFTPAKLTMIAIRNVFPDKTTANKKITKKVTKLDKDTAILTFEGICIVIKDSKDITDTIGCEIIKCLTKQLDGTIISIKNENGTAYELVFPIEMEHTIH